MNPSTTDRLRMISKPKLVLVIIVGLVLFALALSVLRMFLVGSAGVSHQMMPAMDYGYMNETKDYAMTDSVGIAMERSIAPSAPIPQPGGSVGGDAEEYESLSYNATVKAGDHEPVCDVVESWKPLTYVVFEHASRSDTGCRYTFKVEREHAAAILEEVEALEPSDITANTQTLKRQVVEYDGQLQILLKREEHLKNTLEQAVDAYDQVTALATQVEDAEVLSTIIRNRINDIKRLTDEQIALSRQIDAVVRQSSELQDRIEYVSFSLYVQKYQVLDGDRMKDQWVRAMQQFVNNVNETVQALSLGLLSNLLKLIVLAIYITILVVVLKFGWHAAQRFWMK